MLTRPSRLPATVSVICLVACLSTLAHFPYLTSAPFPIGGESQTLAVLDNYVSQTEFSPVRPPLAYFIFLITQLSSGPIVAFRILPAVLSAIIPVLLTTFILLRNTSVSSSLFCGVMLLLESSFARNGRALAPDAVFDFFSACAVLASIFHLQRRSRTALVLEALFVALALATDPTGVVLLLQLLIANAPTSTKAIADYWARVGLLLGVGASVWFCVLMFHISAVSGPSDIFPFRTRFLGVVAAIATRRRTRWSWAAARQINPIVLACAVAGVASAGHKYFACGLIIAVASMLWSAESLCMKVHLVEVIGILPFCW
jgi:hypothetical protein